MNVGLNMMGHCSLSKARRECRTVLSVSNEELWRLTSTLMYSEFFCKKFHKFFCNLFGSSVGDLMISPFFYLAQEIAKYM